MVSRQKRPLHTTPNHLVSDTMGSFVKLPIREAIDLIMLDHNGEEQAFSMGQTDYVGPFGVVLLVTSRL